MFPFVARPRLTIINTSIHRAFFNLAARFLNALLLPALLSIISEKQARRARFIFVCGALVFFAASPYAAAEPTYNHTKDKKTLIWIPRFKPGDQATWSGVRDEDGYATGTGVLTWYKVDLSTLTGSRMPLEKAHIFRRYSGKMVRGKLQGLVTIEADGNTYHAKFVDGEPTTDLIAGPVPTRAPAPAKAHHEHAVAEATPAAREEKPSSSPAVPGEGPSPSPQIYQPTSREAPASGHGDSLRSLTMPPSSLQRHKATETGSVSVQPGTPAKSSDAGSENSADATAVAALDTQYQAAVKANDAETMDRILADDFVLVTGAGRNATKADLLKAAREKQTIYEHQEEEAGTQTVHIWGDTAVVTAQLWVKGTTQGAPIDYKLWFSDTYRKTPDGWRYVFGQASLPRAE